ncbi:IS21 family transposase [Agrobacterium burrii]
MPRRKQARHTDVKDIRSILRLTFEQGLSIRAVSERLKISKTSVSTYLLRAKEAGLAVWPLPPGLDEDDVLEHRLFRRMGRPPRDTVEPDWPKMASELKRKGVTLHLLWQEYREAHPDGYGYTWFCGRFADHESRARPTYRSRHVAGVAMECDYAGHTIPIIDPSTGEIRSAQIYVAVLSAPQLTFAYASFSQKLPDWIEANQRAFSYFGGVTKTTICDNLKSAVAKALWFEPTLNTTFAAFAEHYDTTVVPARPRHPRDKPSAEGTVLIVERWVLARLRNERFFSLVDLNIRISALIEDLNTRTMRRYGKSRRALFNEVERSELKPLPSTPFEYAEWKTAKVHPDYHVEVDKTFYSVPHGLIGKRVDVRLTYRAVEIFFDHKRVASHIRSSQRSGHVTVNEHMPKAHQRYANTTPQTLRREAAKVGTNTATFIERLLSHRPHPEQGYRSAQGILSLARRYQSDRLELACERALVINALSYSSVANILRSGLDQAPAMTETVKPAPPHGNIRGKTYYQ